MRHAHVSNLKSKVVGVASSSLDHTLEENQTRGYRFP
jgi:hypothetical protein